MAQQRMALWAAEDIDEELQDVDLSLAIGSYGQNGFDEGALVIVREPCPCAHMDNTAQIPPQIDESTLISVQQHMAQQAAFAQIPDVVKGVCGPAWLSIGQCSMFHSSSFTSIKRYWTTT